VDAFLDQILPPAQQAGGNRERLLGPCMSLLTSRDRLVDLAPARLPGRPNGSAVVILTETDVVIADVDTRVRIAGEIRFPRATIVRAEVVPTRRPLPAATTSSSPPRPALSAGARRHSEHHHDAEAMAETREPRARRPGPICETTARKAMTVSHLPVPCAAGADGGPLLAVS